jgi:pterin-4a-carbinolamine dehydratase
MKVKVTCLKCGYIIEKDLEVELDTNRFAEALKFLQQQAQEHHHPEVNDSFKWRLGWESPAL